MSYRPYSIPVMEHYMDDLPELLGAFGLTRLEAQLYQALFVEGPLNGYEAAKSTGISRSNAYTALASLVDKGAAWLVDGNPSRYTPVPVAEFTGNRIAGLERKRDRIIASMPERATSVGGYVTIRGDGHIRDRLRNLVSGASERVYLACHADLLSTLRDELEAHLAAGKKLVVITSSEAVLPGGETERLTGAEVHVREGEWREIRAIADSRFVLTGELSSGSNATALFSDEPNLVELIKSALRNEITLADLGRDKEARR